MQAETAVIGFIGGGNMAQAIIKGLLGAGHAAERILVSDPAPQQQAALQALSADLQLNDHATLARSCDLLVLAVKPQIVPQVAQAMADIDRPATQVMVSIAAGITLQSLHEWLGTDTNLIRVMPNTPALIGAGMSGLYADPSVADPARQLAAYVMEAAGDTLWVSDEALLDSLTALSGSGPAYFFLLMEIMQEVGQELGFDAEQARLLATRTAAGAGLLAAQAEESPATLRTRVTSPGGTTEAALRVLENNGIRDIFRSALIAARDRATELGKDT